MNKDKGQGVCPQVPKMLPKAEIIYLVIQQAESLLYTKHWGYHGEKELCSFLLELTF